MTIGKIVGALLLLASVSGVLVTLTSQTAGALSPGEGSGTGWCGAYGGTNLGSYDNIYACYGPSAPPTPFNPGYGGFQCTELANRYLYNVKGDTVFGGSLVGGNFVSTVSTQYGISTGSSGGSAMPVAGDIISMWGGSSGQPQDGDDTHVAVVTSVSGGTITTLNQNDVSDSNGDNGFNTITVSGSSWSFNGGYYTSFEWLNLASGISAPTISSVSPDEGEIGTLVTIGGSGLANASSVTFNGVTATISSDSASTIKTSVPSGATTGNVAVTTPYGSVSAAFTVDDGASEETPAMVLNQSSYFDLDLVRGPDNSLDAYWDTIGQHWNGPSVIAGAGSTFSTPAMVINQSTDFVMALVEGPNNTLDAYWDTVGQPWAGPTQVGAPGSTFSAPALVLNQATNFASALVQGPKNSLDVYWVTIGQPWAGPDVVGGPGTTYSAPTTVLDPETNFQSALVEGPANSLYDYWVTIGQPWAGPAVVAGASSTYAVVGQVLLHPASTLLALTQGSTNSLDAYWVQLGQPWNGPATVAGSRTIYVDQPQVDVINPSGRGERSAKVVLTVTGNGFEPGATISVSGQGVTLGSMSVVSATSITATVSVSASAKAGPRTVTVTNPDGTVDSCAGCFQVTPAPTMVSVSPSTVAPGAKNVKMTLSGADYQSGAKVTVSGAGVKVESTAVIGSTRITVVINVAAAAAAGTRTVTVTNPNGGAVHASLLRIS